ncbi:MAG: hypothetical protein UR93_C0005G0016 [Berkelbacteria bacterium GW2011_GWA2_35_9]|uniref:G5 domain-containing protein n=1 Tax=Berkelbacteria bacterium GW2011_GWA2_35_9 TaxID=1618333 RepID=A0A0G0FNC1_9BACT|nr:MAG: hypothetical protein UR93_C0005G0016 [Berkelbacteria bacterium GW2011_GWA2_35_9]
MLKKLLALVLLPVLFVFVINIVPEESNTEGQVLGVSVAKAEQDKEDSRIKIENYFADSSINNFKDFVKKNELTIYPQDKITIFPDLGLGLGAKISIKRSLNVTVLDAKYSREHRTFAKNVDEFLKEKSIELGGLDKIDPVLAHEIDAGLEIEIIRVEKTNIDEKEKIAYTTIRKEDPEMWKGEEKVTQKGQNGEKKLTYEVTRENGIEKSRKLIKTETTKEAVEEIIYYGTKEVVYGVGKATWYSAPAMSAAHNTLPRGTMVLVTNISNGKQVMVKIVGPGIQSNAIIDLSPDAFSQLAPLGAGTIQVKLTKP